MRYAMQPNKLDIPSRQISAFCERWRVTALALFGSVTRDDFGPDSDVDVLVTFTLDARHSLHDLIRMQDELTALFGRRVDLVESGAVRNPFRRHEIMRTRKVIYAA